MEGKSRKSLFLYKRKPVLKETDAKGEGGAKGKEGIFFVNAFCVTQNVFLINLSQSLSAEEGRYTRQL